MLFCVLVGTGVQLLCMGFVTIAFAAIGYANFPRCTYAVRTKGHKCVTCFSRVRGQAPRASTPKKFELFCRACQNQKS